MLLLVLLSIVLLLFRTLSRLLLLFLLRGLLLVLFSCLLLTLLLLSPVFTSFRPLTSSSLTPLEAMSVLAKLTLMTDDGRKYLPAPSDPR